MKLKQVIKMLTASSLLFSSFAHSALTASFRDPDGIVNPSESIPVWVTISADEDFFFDGSDPDGDGTFGNLDPASYPIQGFDRISHSRIDFAMYERASTSVSFTCSGSFPSGSSCTSGEEYKFTFNTSNDPTFFGHDTFTLDAGESHDVLFGTFAPTNGLAAPAGTYNFYAANFTINMFGFGFDADGNQVNINASFNLASTCTTGDNSCDFSRTVVPVPAALWLFASAGLGLAGFRKYLNPLN